MNKRVRPAQFEKSLTSGFYGHDHLLSVVCLFDAAGGPAERYEYDAYGSVQILNSAFSILNSSQYANPYTFTGCELDTLDAGSLRLMYYRARTYDPETGRFMQRDPLGINPAGGSINFFEPTGQYADGMNIYEYVQNNPAIGNDRFGLVTNDEEDIFWICYRMTRTDPPKPLHAYLFYGGSSTNPPWGPSPLGEGWGFSQGGAKSERFFNPTKCRRCTISRSKWRKINYGPAKNKSCCHANGADVWSCVKAYPPRKEYSVPDYVCLHYAEEAKKQCCLTCDIRSVRAPSD